MIKALIFDLDETLILDAPVSEQAFFAAAQDAALHYPVQPQPVAEAAKEAAMEIWREGPFFEYCDRIGHSAFEGLWASYSQPTPEIQGLAQYVTSYRQAVWRKALGRFGVREFHHLHRMVEAWIRARKKYPFYPEVFSLLEALHPKYSLGMVTNGVPDLQRQKIGGANLGMWFKEIAVSGELGVGKPDPKIFQWICQRLAVKPAECVMVGDNPERDVAGAIAAGMRSVLVNRGYKKPNPRFPADLEVKDLNQILPWLLKQ